MSFQDPNAFYEETLLLLDKNEETPTPITEGQVENGDLTPFRHRIELVNTGNQLQNNGILTLRIPPDGTFVRKEPILIDESAKDDYIIQAQIKQDRNKDGVFEEEGRLFRFFIGQPTLQDDEFVGETLKINLIPVEYRTRETLDAERLEDSDQNRRDPFATPQEAFVRRAISYNDIRGVDNTQLLFTSTGSDPSLKLPDADSLKQQWRPLAPTSTHDLFREVVGRQSLAGVEGGVFEDFFFDYEPVPVSTKTVFMKAEAEGTVDRGVVLDPLTFDTSDTQKDNEINVDLIKFKNHIIAQGSPFGGSLPREGTVFASLWEHGKARPDWDANVQYTSGSSSSLGDNQSQVRYDDPVVREIRFFKAIKDNIGVDPTVDSSRAVAWEEDFTVTPPWNVFAEYETGDTITRSLSGTATFFTALSLVSKGEAPPEANNKWLDIGRTFPDGTEHPLFSDLSFLPTGLDRAGRTQFFSYTPWTEDYEAMFNTSLLGVEDTTQKNNFTSAGYQGVVPDWNYVRANFDREVADSRFELVVGKDVQKLVDSLSDIKVGDRHFGNRWQVASNFVAPDLSAHKSQIAEWVGTDFATGSINVDEDLKFSRNPKDGETIIDRARGVWRMYSTSADTWQDLWNIVDNTEGAVEDSLVDQIVSGGIGKFTTTGIITGVISSLLKDTGTFGSSTAHSPLHICRDTKLVAGASGIPGQAFEMRYDWSAIESIEGFAGIRIPIPNADRKNFSSIGAWWFMQFPYPKIEGFGREVGDKYKKPYIDTNNLDINHENIAGWNEGLFSEDLGRIQRVSFKARLSLFGSVTGGLVLGYADMPMKMWAVDIFDRVWYADYKIRRNGEFSLAQLSFGENSVQQIHHGRYDELLKVMGIILDTNWALQEKEFTGIEFDWRFVKSMGMFYNVGYNSQGLYVGNQFIDFVFNIAEQAVGQGFGLLATAVSQPQEDYNPNDLLINNARLAIDELKFEKQLYATSNRLPVDDARTELTHLASEDDYINLQLRAQATRERRKFVEQAWFMQAHGDVRLRFGEKFTASGPRVPTGTQDLICNEVKHIIDSDGYMMQLTGKRKFVFEDD